MNSRTKHYKVTITKKHTGETQTKLVKFTQAQANDVSTVLESDGISLEKAKELCEFWTKLGNQEDVKYVYSIPFVKQHGN